MADDDTFEISPGGTEPNKGGTTVEAPELSFRKFLEQTPPDTYVQLTDLEVTSNVHYLQVPDILLFCHQSDCDGPRMFRAKEPLFFKSGWNFSFLEYVCRNCGRRLARFAIAFTVLTSPAKDVKGTASALKVGQMPTFGPQSPAQLISLVGPDRELFLQGRRAENRGMGLGAFAYYRRVVENQSSRIIGRIARVVKALGSTPEIDAVFVAAMNESQFSRSIELVKDFIPQALLIKGENPLLLLHTALSKGLHNPEMTDSHCLEVAQSIRTVLTELSERATNALKDDAEIQNAIKTLRAVPRGPRLTPENVRPLDDAIGETSPANGNE